MKQQYFEESSRESWHLFTQILDDKTHADIENFPKLYRKICHDLAFAKQRRYTPNLVDYLNELVMRGHHCLYQKSSRKRFKTLDFILGGFPRIIRENRLFVYLALVIFVGPTFLVGALCYYNSEMVYSTMPYEQVQMLESMYDPDSEVLGRTRESDTDLMMFGFYIKNNIGIGFRTFATGILFCIGSIFFLVYNGIVIGGSAGYLTQLGYTETFYPFVIGHGAFELTAIVFSGAAGLKLGYALINPGLHPRVQALKFAANDAIQIMMGVTLMLVIAAFLEAFWSSSTHLPIDVKYIVGAIMWILVCLYFIFTGRPNRNGSQ